MATTLLSGQKNPDEQAGYVPLSTRTFTQAKNVNEANLFYQQKRKEAEIQKQIEAKKKELMVDTSQFDMQAQAIQTAKDKTAAKPPPADIGTVKYSGDTTLASVARGSGWNVGGYSFSRAQAMEKIEKYGYFEVHGFKYTPANAYLLNEKYAGWKKVGGELVMVDPQAYTLAKAQWDTELAAYDKQLADVLGQKSAALNQSATNVQNELAKQEQTKNANKVGNAQSGQGLNSGFVQRTNPFEAPPTTNTLLTGK